MERSCDTMSTVLLLPTKPARKLLLKTSGLAALVVMVGCQQQIKPPVTEIPTTEKIQSSIPKEQADTDVAIEPSLPEQIDWNRRSREIARTELSPFLRKQRRKSTKPNIESPPTIPPKSSQDKIEAHTPIENTPATQTIGETSISVISGAPTAIISKDPTKTAAKLLSQNQPESAILTINGGRSSNSLSKSASRNIENQSERIPTAEHDNCCAAILDAEMLRYIESETLVIVARKILKS